MAYSPQTEQQALSDLIETYSSLVPIADDMNRGSAIRSLFSAFAIELKRINVGRLEQTLANQRQWGYTAFKFARLQPQAAYTLEQFTVTTAPTQDTLVPAGTTVAIPGTTIQYQTPNDFTWPAGSTTENITVVCTQTGSIGNARANTITQLVSSVSGLTGLTVTNPKALITGTDLETDSARAQRFTKFVGSIHRGDLVALQYGASTAQLVDDYGYITEQVRKVQVIEGSGSNTIYIDNGTYDTSSALVTQCQTVINGYKDSNGNYIDGYKAAGIPSTVVAASIQTVTVTASITLNPGYTLAMVQQTISDNITNLVESLNIGDTLYVSDIGRAIGNVPGVLNYTLSSPSGDTVPSNGTLLKLASTPSITAA